jgi:hypothetical protein
MSRLFTPLAATFAAPIVALLVAITLVAAACGDDSTDVGAGPDDTIPAGPAQTTTVPDGPLGAGPYPIAELTVTYEHPDVGTLEYRIVCLGDTATLIDGPPGVGDQAACLALADEAVQRRLIDGPPADLACTEIYGGPEGATFAGRVDDRPVAAAVDRSNGCGIADWDGPLAALLPPPRPFE